MTASELPLTRPAQAQKILYEGQVVKIVCGRHGLYVVNGPSYHGRVITNYGEHTQNELSFVANFVAPNDFVIDVGAHQGAHTLFFARTVGPDGLVIMIEPQRVMLQHACATTALNDHYNVIPVHAAVGDNETPVRITDYDYSKPGAPSQMKIRPENQGEIVPQVTLDGLLRQRRITRRVAFLKIDVEGMEDSVLRGASALIEQSQPVVYFECHKKARSSEPAISLLKAHEYVVFRHEPPGFNPGNFFGLDEDRFNGGLDHNAVAVPVEELERFGHALEGLERL